MTKKKILQTRLKHFLNTQEDTLAVEEEGLKRELTLLKREETVEINGESLISDEVIFERHKIEELKKNRKRQLDRLSEIKTEIGKKKDEQSNLVGRLDFEEGKNTALKERIQELQVALKELDRDYDLKEREFITLKEVSGNKEVEYKQLILNKEERLKDLEEAKLRNEELTTRISKKSVEKNEVDSLIASHSLLIQNLKEEIHQNVLKVESLETVLKEARIQIDQQESTIKRSEGRVKELYEHTEHKDSELFTRKKEITAKELALSELATKEHNLIGKNEELNRQKKMLNENLSTLNKRIIEDVQHNEELKETIEKLENTLELKKERVQEQENKLNQLETQSRSFSKHASEVRILLHEREEELDQLSKNSKKISVSINDRHAETATLQKKTRDLESEIRVKNEDFLTFEKELSELIFEKGSKQSLVNGLEQQLKEYDLKLESVVSDIDSNEKISTNLGESMQELEELVISRELEIKDKENAYSGLSEDLRNRKFSLSRLNKKLQELESELILRKKQVTTIKFEGSHLVKERNQLKSQMKNVNSALMVFNARIKGLKTSIKKVETGSRNHKNNISAANIKYKSLMTENTQLEIEFEKNYKTYETLKFNVSQNEKTNKVLRINIRKFKKSLEETNKKILKHQGRYTVLISKQEILQREHDAILEESNIADTEWRDIQAKFSKASESLEQVEDQLRTEEENLLKLHEERNHLISQCHTRELLLEKRKEEILKAESEKKKLQSEILKSKDSLEYLHSETMMGKLSLAKTQEDLGKRKVELTNLKKQYEASHGLYMDQRKDLDQQSKVLAQMEQARARYMQLITELVDKNDEVQMKLQNNNQLMDQFHKDILLLKSYQKQFIS